MGRCAHCVPNKLWLWLEHLLICRCEAATNPVLIQLLLLKLLAHWFLKLAEGGDLRLTKLLKILVLILMLISGRPLLGHDLLWRHVVFMYLTMLLSPCSTSLLQRRRRLLLCLGAKVAHRWEVSRAYEHSSASVCRCRRAAIVLLLQTAHTLRGMKQWCYAWCSWLPLITVRKTLRQATGRLLLLSLATSRNWLCLEASRLFTHRSLSVIQTKVLNCSRRMHTYTSWKLLRRSLSDISAQTRSLLWL